ncbi:MAG: hypothetical protein H6923_03255 [Alphaproteobacteria bacterium]|nr:hypothetical protein [Alphaproteobacteria bacterium]
MEFVIRHIRRWIGWVFVGLGCIFFPLPIPLGLPFLLIGGALVISDSPTAQRVVRYWRRRYKGIDGHIFRVAPHMPAFVRRLVEKTEPRPLRRAVRAKGPADPGPPPESPPVDRTAA